MKLIVTIGTVIAIFSLAACEDTGHYPISGEECGPSDPVKDLDSHDCLIPII